MKKIIFFFILLLFGCWQILVAQDKQVHFNVSKITVDSQTQRLIIKASIAKGYQMLAMSDIPGYEGVKTTILFDTALQQKLQGALQEKTQTISIHSPALENKEVKCYVDSAAWEQDIHLNVGDSFRLKGAITTYLLKGDEIETISENISREFVYIKESDRNNIDKTNKPASGRSVWGWLVAGILAGLIGFLTPCVYSLVPVTVSLFLKRSKTSAEGRKSALFYSLSIVMIYAFVGVLSVSFVPQSAWNTISTSWVFNMLVFILFVVFGISFLGAFEISLPSSWATRLDRKSGLGTYSGVFFMALTLVVVSFSCTGNFVASLLGVASRDNKWAAIFGMTGFGLGLALPFSVFAVFPSWLKEISKPGGWQNALKVSLGVLELALAMKFLSNADIQFGKYWLTRDIYLSLWIALFTFLTVYLLGGFKMKHDSGLPKNDWDKEFIPLPRFFFALLSLAFTIYLMPGLWGAPLNKISGLLPPFGSQEYTGAVVTYTPKDKSGTIYKIKPEKYYNELIKNESEAAKKAGLEVFFDYKEAMEAAKEQGKPLMIDFTGIVCPNCREFENRVWTRPDVMNKMKNNFVVASLFEDFSGELPDVEKRHSDLLGADLATVGDLYKELSMKLTGGISQPNYVFLYQDGSKIFEKGYGYDNIQKNGPEDFAVYLDKVLEEFASNKARH